MATYTFTLQGTSPTTIEATDIIQFAGSTFGSAINVGSYNDSTHVESSVGANDSNGNAPHNTKYIDSTHVSLDGAASALVSSITTAQCPLKVNFSHGSAVAVSGHKLYGYDGTTTANPPTDITLKLAQQGDASWVEAGGSGNALSVDDSASASSHDFYFLMSVSPSAVGVKTNFKFRDELTYS